MLFDPDRHESLRVIEWNEHDVRATIQGIVDDTEARFDTTTFWPIHPRDTGRNDRPPLGQTNLYSGACGVIWALRYLQDRGAVRLGRDYRNFLKVLRDHNEQWLGEVYAKCATSYLMGDTPFLMMDCIDASDCAVYEDRLAALIAANEGYPTGDFMWGSPGTLLASVLLYEHLGHSRWAGLFRQTAAELWSQLQWSEEFQCHYWAQDMHGRRATYLDAIHGFVGTAFALIKGRHLLDPDQWHDWEQCIVNTIERTATVEGDFVNWRVHLVTPKEEKTRFQLQYCHGAPGFVICLAALPSKSLDPLLIRAGQTIWSAGPLTKGSNLCHGTGGNGYAFLKLFQRTGDTKWLDYARAFAMHGIGQTAADRALYGQGQYSLWTGDLGFAIYLNDCLTGKANFPTLDTFFVSKSSN